MNDASLNVSDSCWKMIIHKSPHWHQNGYCAKDEVAKPAHVLWHYATGLEGKINHCTHRVCCDLLFHGRQQRNGRTTGPPRTSLAVSSSSPTACKDTLDPGFERAERADTTTDLSLTLSEWEEGGPVTKTAGKNWPPCDDWLALVVFQRSLLLSSSVTPLQSRKNKKHPLREQTISPRVVSQDCTTAIITLMSMNVPQIPEELHFQAHSLEALLAHDNTSCLKNFPFLPQTNENWYVNMARCRKSSRSHSQDSFVFWFVLWLFTLSSNANHADYTQKPNIMGRL